MYSPQKTTRELRAHLNTLLNNELYTVCSRCSRSCCVFLLLRAFFFLFPPYSICGLVEGKWRKMEVEALWGSRFTDLDCCSSTPSPANHPATATPRSFEHGCSHQRQPCISEEPPRTLQKLASGLSAGGCLLPQTPACSGYPWVGPEEEPGTGGRGPGAVLQRHHGYLTGARARRSKAKAPGAHLALQI